MKEEQGKNLARASQVGEAAEANGVERGKI